MTRTMYDSTSSRDIPQGVAMVAGYVDGAYAWSAFDWALHVGAVKVRITCTTADPSAQVADIELGCLTINQGADWAAAKVRAGEFPWLYFSASLFASVAWAMQSRGVRDDQWGAWVAQWDGVAQLLPNNSLKQYANPALSGGHYDLSIAADYLPGIDPPPTPVPAPPPAPAPPPPPPPGPPPPPPPAPAPGPPIDQTRSAWASLAAFLTQDLPAAVSELLRLLGLFRNTP